jgi:mono/diheme cytochrome c family protein
MSTALRTVATLVAVLLLLGVVALGYVVSTGLGAKPQPGPLETRLARAVRGLAIPGTIKALRNPTAASPEIVAEGTAHWADHCASCHGNDGSGDTEMGRGLFPKAPDMRQSPTQSLTDGELFYIIENGVRFTGMPAWSSGTPAGEESTWHLVQFIRHLPHLSADELERMQALNPRSPDEIRQEIEEEKFLTGDDAVVAPSSPPHEH